MMGRLFIVEQIVYHSVNALAPKTCIKEVNHTQPAVMGASAQVMTANK